MSQFARLLLSCPESISRVCNSFRPWRTSTEQIHSSSSVAVKVDFTILKCALTVIGVRKSASKSTWTAPEVLSTVFQPISTAPAVPEPHSKGMWTRVNDRVTVSSGLRAIRDSIPLTTPPPSLWSMANNCSRVLIRLPSALPVPVCDRQRPYPRHPYPRLRARKPIRRPVIPGWWFHQNAFFPSN